MLQRLHLTRQPTGFTDSPASLLAAALFVPGMLSVLLGLGQASPVALALGLITMAAARGLQVQVSRHPGQVGHSA